MISLAVGGAVPGALEGVGRGEALEAAPGAGVGAEEPVEDGRDHPGPVRVEGCGPAVSLAVTSFE